jgi:hypothetical protein
MRFQNNLPEHQLKEKNQKECPAALHSELFRAKAQVPNDLQN